MKKYTTLAMMMVKNGEKLEDIAKLLNISVGSVSNKLTGKTEFYLNEVRKLTAHYGMSFEELFKKE